MKVCGEFVDTCGNCRIKRPMVVTVNLADSSWLCPFCRGWNEPVEQEQTPEPVPLTTFEGLEGKKVKRISNGDTYDIDCVHKSGTSFAFWCGDSIALAENPENFCLVEEDA